MRVSFDSNAWEKIFDPADQVCEPIRVALAARKLEGFVCEAGFRIEAVKKQDRVTYFAEPHMSIDSTISCTDGVTTLNLSLGPDDGRHPGIPAQQAVKWQRAHSAGIHLMRGIAWMGLPASQELLDPAVFVEETRIEFQERERRQIAAFSCITNRGVGKAAFDAAGGWTLPVGRPAEEKKFRKACAEWADGELVGAHIAYQNDILCTDDHALSAGASIFDESNRLWLLADYGVKFRTVAELLKDVSM